MLKVNKRHTKTKSELFSNSPRKTPEQCHQHHLDVFVATFEHISHLVQLFLLLTLTSVEQYIKQDRKTAVASFSI